MHPRFGLGFSEHSASFSDFCLVYRKSMTATFIFSMSSYLTEKRSFERRAT